MNLYYKEYVCLTLLFKLNGWNMPIIPSTTPAACSVSDSVVNGGGWRLVLSCSLLVLAAVCVCSSRLCLKMEPALCCMWRTGDTNFRLFNNRTYNLFPVSLHIGPESLLPADTHHRGMYKYNGSLVANVLCSIFNCFWNETVLFPSHPLSSRRTGEFVLNSWSESCLSQRSNRLNTGCGRLYMCDMMLCETAFISPFQTRQ